MSRLTVIAKEELEEAMRLLRHQKLNIEHRIDLITDDTKISGLSIKTALQADAEAIGVAYAKLESLKQLLSAGNTG